MWRKFDFLQKRRRELKIGKSSSGITKAWKAIKDTKDCVLSNLNQIDDLEAMLGSNESFQE